MKSRTAAWNAAFPLAAALASAGLFASLHAGCSGESSTNTTGSGGSGGSTTSSTTGETASSSSSSASSTTTSSSGTGGTGGTGSTGSTGGTGGTGTGGAGGGSGGAWPTCDAPEPGAVTKTLHEIYVDDPAQPVEVWVPGVYVTAVSKGGCTAGVACQFYVQQELQYADLAAGSQQALKVFVSANAATHFTSVAVGQKVDIDAWAWRYNLMGEDELLLQVNLQLEGCAKAVGAGDAVPVPVQLDQLMFPLYNDVGPLLVTVPTVSGKPQMPTETFGLWKTGVFMDAGVDNIVSLSPYFLPGAAFNGLVQGTTTDFTSVTGVFGLFVPPGSMSKYREIYPRSDSEYPIAPPPDGGP